MQQTSTKEARLLAKNNGPERAFSLSVTCLEELAKSFACKAVWIGKANPTVLTIRTKRGNMNALVHHQVKQLIIGYYIWIGQIKKENPRQFNRIVSIAVAAVVDLGVVYSFVAVILYFKVYSVVIGKVSLCKSKQSQSMTRQAKRME